MKKNLLLLAVTFLCLLSVNAANKDVLTFGNKQSEQKHSLKSVNSEAYVGGMNETARRMLPPETEDYKGGEITFRMKVDPKKQNYFTARFWGSESMKNLLMLFIEGKQIGYRHLGDMDVLFLGNGNAPLQGRFFYVTLPLPMEYTKDKQEVELGVRSFGPMWPYGETFERYQKNMTDPTIGLYKGYTHTQPCFEPDKKEKQGKAPVYQLRKTPGKEVFTALKERVNKEVNQILAKDLLRSQLEMWTLADAYTVSWTTAYNHPKCISLLRASINDFYKRYKANPELIWKDATVYNCDWLNAGPIARVIRYLWKEFEPVISPEERAQWTELMLASLDYSTTHRRHYTNQSMIIDLFIYDVNKALSLLEPLKALPEYQTLKYLHESLGLCPWTGINNACPLGNNYWQLTKKGLTKELGFVGYYGEVLDWVGDIYRSTCVNGMPGTGDPQIEAQLLRMANARSYFRYPGVDADGYSAMLAEAVVGWRDGDHYPGEVTYAERVGWDASPLSTATLTLDKVVVGMAQQMISDNQFFASIERKMKDGGLRVTKALLHIPEQYDAIMKQPASSFRMPMSKESPDFVFSDEEDGVITVKNGDEILYASLYWRARNAVNNLAKVHYITPLTDLLSTVRIEQEFEDSGMRYTRQDWVNLGFAPWREWYKDVHSAHAGEVLPVARIPKEVPFKVGDENAYAGRAQFYKMEYGKYIVGMNSAEDKTFDLQLPQRAKGSKIVNLTDGRKEVEEEVITVQPMSTVVLFVE